MIVVRDVFRLKFGKAKDMKALVKEAYKLNTPMDMKNTRILTDLTGPSYTMVFESTFNSLADFESSLQKMFSSKEWEAHYQKMILLVESSIREIYSVIE